MDDQTLLNDDELPEFDQNKNYLSEMVGEGKKFKTSEDLAKGKFHADQTIELMKRRLDELTNDYTRLREDNMSKAKLEELIEQLNQRQQQPSNENTQVKDSKPMIDPDQLDSLISNKVQQMEISKKQAENFKMVQSKLKEKWGDNYPTALKRQLDNLGLDKDFVDNMAKNHPTALIKTLGLEDQPAQDSFFAPPRSAQRQDNFSPTGKEKRTWSYYQELKKTNPSLYFDPKMAVQIQKDAIELGEEFRDGDYYKKGLHEPNY